ncbi:MAG: aspartate--tRNA ligase [Candidatus Pacebacteria bacterium]|nr:aspartate--tRNA ligase [Candidatus Paceibacterota bacterium]
MERILIKEAGRRSGEKVKLAGWVQSIRSHGKIIFFDLRDASGVAQIVFTPKDNEELYEKAKEVRPEWVVEIEGEVKERPEGMQNQGIETGNMEIKAFVLNVFSQAKTIPFPIDTDGYEINEKNRLEHRYVDIRRPRIKRNLEARHKAIKFMRDFLVNEGFIEVETPVLTKSTPEGARDFVVPSRNYSGKFYALPQSPQQYKQLLMVAGVEKYFQVARCFRDEDPRGDRQPEFTQMDIEVAFWEQKEILDLVERLHADLIKELFPGKKIMKSPFPVLTYKEAMEKYGTDRPDIRKDKNDADELAFCFVVDFPMFEYKEGDKRWGAMHNPFTRPQTEDIEEIKNNKESVLAHQYDLVLNGQEIAGGALRSYKPDILEAVFESLGYSKEEIKKQFGHLLQSFEYGVPPHGGIGFGLDRFLAVVLNEPSIREVIAFPKTGDNKDLMMDSPSDVSKEQLKELHLKIEKNEKE